MKKIMLLVALALSACARDTRLPASNVAYDVGPRTVREFRLQDGTRCVSMADSGISCEWGCRVKNSNQPKEVE